MEWKKKNDWSIVKCKEIIYLIIPINEFFIWFNRQNFLLTNESTSSVSSSINGGSRNLFDDSPWYCSSKDEFMTSK
jgi:hypothetical protein